MTTTGNLCKARVPGPWNSGTWELPSVCVPMESRPPSGSRGPGRLSPSWVLLPSMTRTHTGLQASLGNGRSFATWGPGQRIVGQACVDGCWPCGGSDARWSSTGPGSRHPWWPAGVEGGAQSTAMGSHSRTSQGRCSSQNEAALGLSPSEPLGALSIKLE